MAVALSKVDEREHRTVQDNGSLRAGCFTYAIAVERKRLALTREIIRRVEPAGAEDGGYLEMLAREAASIEMLLHPELPDLADGSSWLDRILIGTIGEPRSKAWTRRVGDFSVIAVSAGMMYAYYQFSKAIVLSWPIVERVGKCCVTFDNTFEAVERVLDSDSNPLTVAYDSLSSWLFDGVARPSNTQAPTLDFQLPLSLLIKYAERFVLAHEYAHALIDNMGQTVRSYPPTELEQKDKEIRADVVAMDIVAMSAHELDDVAPNVALNGALMAIKVHQIVDEALHMFGKPLPPSETHPPFDVRSDAVRHAYLFDYYFRNPCLVPRGLLPASRTAEQLWRRLKTRLEEDRSAGRTLHPIWS
jgi:hypothetical protein